MSKTCRHLWERSLAKSGMHPDTMRYIARAEELWGCKKLAEHLRMQADKVAEWHDIGDGVGQRPRACGDEGG